MIEILFKPSFIKQLNKLEDGLVEEVFAKIEFFKNPKNHSMLKVHKLHGVLKGSLSFSVNYKTRIIFEYESKKSVVFLTIGDHDMYK